jgi:hypothetical protein
MSVQENAEECSAPAFSRGDAARRPSPAFTPSMDIAARRDDPGVEELARSIYALFPRCMRCGAPIDRYEDADVRILTNRVVHRGACSAAEDASAAANESGRS